MTRRHYSADELAEVRAAMPEYLANVHGITDLRKRFRCIHPEHPDHDPSMTYYPANHTVKCWSCGEGGDIFTVAGWDTGATEFTEKVEAAAAGAGIRLSGNRGRPGRVPVAKAEPKEVVKDDKRPCTENLWEHVARAYSALYDDPGAAGALDLLHGRGLSDEIITRHGLGWARHPEQIMPGRFGGATKATGGYIILPFPDDGQWESVRYVCARPVGQGGRRKEEKPYKAPAQLWNDWLLAAGRTVYVTEGIFDAMALEVLGGVDAMAVCGTGNVPLLGKRLSAVPAGDRSKLVIVMDNDTYGRKAEGKAAEVLGGIDGAEFKIARLVPEQYKDANDWLMGLGRCA